MSHDTPETNASDLLENARVEYAAANDAYMHYDNFTWQVGSVLLAGVFVYWGFIISTPPALLTLLLGNVLVCVLMSVWLLYAAHNRQIYVFKLHRIYELEKRLGMEQHTRFTDCNGRARLYCRDGPSGHFLDACVYVIVSVGGVLPGISQSKRTDWTWLHLLVFAVTTIIVVAIVWRVRLVDTRTRLRIGRIDDEKKQPQMLASETRIALTD